MIHLSLRISSEYLDEIIISCLISSHSKYFIPSSVHILQIYMEFQQWKRMLWFWFFLYILFQDIHVLENYKIYWFYTSKKKLLTIRKETIWFYCMNLISRISFPCLVRIFGRISPLSSLTWYISNGCQNGHSWCLIPTWPGSPTILNNTSQCYALLYIILNYTWQRYTHHVIPYHTIP